MRLLIAAVAAVLGYVSVSQTLAHVLSRRDPERAYALSLGDGRITARFAQSQAGLEATRADRARADDIARAALRRDPTAVAAVETLGLNAQVRGDTVGARRLFAYAERLSRRELQTQIWAIEDAVSRQYIAGALRHYDVALRTSRRAPDLLFPILGAAISSPDVRVGLVRTLAAQPAWNSDFIDHVAGRGPDPRATVQLMRGLHKAGISVSQGAQAATIAALIRQDLPDEAWSYYVLIHPGADRRVSRDPTFAADITAPSLFDWTPIEDGGKSVAIQRDRRGGLVDFAASPGTGGPLLQQVQLLAPGPYRLVGHSIGIEQPAGSRPYWMLTCRDGRELARIDIPDSVQANGMFASRFTVPAGCPVQTLALVTRPSDAVAGTTGQIDRIQLSPVR